MLNYFNDWWFWFYGFICFLVGVLKEKIHCSYFYLRIIAALIKPESRVTATAVVWILYGANAKDYIKTPDSWAEQLGNMEILHGNLYNAVKC